MASVALSSTAKPLTSSLSSFYSPAQQTQPKPISIPFPFSFAFSIQHNNMLLHSFPIQIKKKVPGKPNFSTRDLFTPSSYKPAQLICPKTLQFSSPPALIEDPVLKRLQKIVVIMNSEGARISSVEEQILTDKDLQQQFSHRYQPFNSRAHSASRDTHIFSLDKRALGKFRIFVRCAGLIIFEWEGCVPPVLTHGTFGHLVRHSCRCATHSASCVVVLRRWWLSGVAFFVFLCWKVKRTGGCMCRNGGGVSTRLRNGRFMHFLAFLCVVALNVPLSLALTTTVFVFRQG